MPKITITEEKAGRIIGSTDDFPHGNKLSNGDAYLQFSRYALNATGPTEGHAVFQLSTEQNPDAAIHKNMAVIGAEGKNNVLILPGNQSDYQIKVAQAPKGLGFKQKFGDISFVTADGNSIDAHNIRSVVFLNGKQDNPINVVNDLYDKKLTPIATQSLHDKAFNAISPKDQCLYKALTTDESASIYKGVNGGNAYRKALETAQNKADQQCKGR